jgi:hypothetical protein
LSRSACAAAAAEVAQGRPVAAAIDALRAAQPRVVLRAAHQAALNRLAQ